MTYYPLSKKNRRFLFLNIPSELRGKVKDKRINRLLKSNIFLNTFNKYLYDGKLPLNLTYWYNIGSILGILLITQIITGIFLACYYIADMNLSFESIEFIMREISCGWLIRYIHANTAAIFFIMVYLHIVKAFLYGSYINKSTWNLGIIIFIVMILTAFIGYSLVGGQMSYWAIIVITNILTIIPYFGNDIVEFIFGGFNISNSTLGRFYVLHYLLPFILVFLSILHIRALHSTPSSACGLPKVTFHSYFTIKDILGFMLVFLVIFSLSFFYPNLLSHTDNYIIANPLVTPTEISPEFYLLYFYMGLKAIPHKVLGVICLLSLILILFLLPYLHRGFNSLNTCFRPLYKIGLYLFLFNYLLGSYIGGEPKVPIIFSKISLIIYFSFFLIYIPFISYLESLMSYYLKRDLI